MLGPGLDTETTGLGTATETPCDPPDAAGVGVPVPRSVAGLGETGYGSLLRCQLTSLQGSPTEVYVPPDSSHPSAQVWPVPLPDPTVPG